MAKPKLALIPAAQGSKFYSVLPSSGVGDFTFSRSGSATRINSQGLIETVADGVSRLNYPLIDGVVKGCPSHILEPQRINLLPYSQDFSNAAWSKSNVTIISNSIISPDGSLNADELQVTSSAGNIYDNIGNIGDGVFSVFAKYKDTQFIRLRSTGSYAYFDIKNGVVGGTINTLDAKIENYGNGWYRCSVIGNNTNSLAQIFVSSDGVNVGLGNVYLWGADFQMGSYPTSHITTNGTIVTRSAETANGSGDVDTFNDSEGVLYFEGSALANDGTYRYISLSDGSNSNNVRVFLTPTSNQILFEVISGASLKFNYTNNNINVLLNTKILVKYKQSDFSIWINGFNVNSSVGVNGGNTPIGLDRLNFDRGTGDTVYYSKTKEVAYYDTVLTDLELETLTSYRTWESMVKELNLNVIYNG